MLVLSRKMDESIMIGNNVTVTIVDIRGDRVRIGIEAPKEVRILRDELRSRYENESDENGGDPEQRA